MRKVLPILRVTMAVIESMSSPAAERAQGFILEADAAVQRRQLTRLLRPIDMASLKSDGMMKEHAYQEA